MAVKELNSNLGNNDAYRYYDSIAKNLEIEISHKTKIKKIMVIYLNNSSGVSSIIIDFENDEKLVSTNGYSNYFNYSTNVKISSYPASHCGVQYKLKDDNTLSIISTIATMSKVHIFIE